MTLDQLRIFVAVAERQHITRAAEALHLTQSAVSAAVTALEGRHATRLFNRVGRRIELSEAGRLFLEEARAVLARAGAAEQMLADLSGMRRGTLSLQASQTIASYWLPAWLVRFRARFPQIAIELAVGNTGAVTAAVLSGAAELGFVEGAVDEAALAGEVVDQDRLVLVVGRDHPWAAPDRTEPADLATSPWVLRETGSGTRSSFEAELVRRAIEPASLAVALTLPSNEAVLAAVAAGAGATVISALVAAAGIATGRLVAVPFACPARDFSVLSSRERYRSRAATAFLDLVRDGLPDES